MDGRPSWIGLVVLVAASALLLGACAQDDSAGPDAGVTVSDLEELDRRITALEDRVGAAEEQGDAAVDGGATEDEELIGQTVTVSGEVTKTIDVNGFVMSSDDEDLETVGPQIGEGILVVSASDPGVSQGDVVQVVGTVREFVIADFEEELGIDLDDDLYREFEDQVALTANSVDTNVPAED